MISLFPISCNSNIPNKCITLWLVLSLVKLIQYFLLKLDTILFLYERKKKKSKFMRSFFSIFGVVFNYFSYKFVVSQPHGSSQRFSKSRYMLANILPLNVPWNTKYLKQFCSIHLSSSWRQDVFWQILDTEREVFIARIMQYGKFWSRKSISTVTLL